MLAAQLAWGPIPISPNAIYNHTGPPPLPSRSSGSASPLAPGFDLSAIMSALQAARAGRKGLAGLARALVSGGGGGTRRRCRAGPADLIARLPHSMQGSSSRSFATQVRRGWRERVAGLLGRPLSAPPASPAAAVQRRGLPEVCGRCQPQARHGAGAPLPPPPPPPSLLCPATLGGGLNAAAEQRLACSPRQQRLQLRGGGSASTGACLQAQACRRHRRRHRPDRVPCRLPLCLCSGPRC